jgi:hypothetical protein
MIKLDDGHSIRIKKVANKLKELRIEAGYSSYESFANDHELPRVQYWRMENGTNFRFSSFLVILDKHKMTLAEFFKQMD